MNKKVNSPKLVDIIIPVYNRPEHTLQTIQSLFDNTDTNMFNVYLVNDCSTDPEIVKILESYLGIAWIFHNQENIGPGASRNQMCDWITKRDARSKYLYHSDNDVYFTHKWLVDLLDVFEEVQKQEVILLGGGCHPYLQNKELIKLNNINFNGVGIKDAVSGYSQLMTWETWDKFGPFDETMRHAEKKIMGSEDWAFCQKIIKAGFKVGSIEPEVVVAAGKTNTYGEPATGAETFKEVEGVKVL